MDDSGTFAVGTWNVRSGRNGGLESALRALRVMGSIDVDLVLLTETKLTDGYYVRTCNNYLVLATDAPSKHQGGVALCWRVSNRFEVKEARTAGSNVITCQL